MNKIIAHRGKTTKKIKENTYLAIPSFAAIQFFNIYQSLLV